MEDFVKEESNINVNADVVKHDMKDANAKILTGAHWFYWIAALSIINIAMASSGRHFIVGLSITQLVAEFFADNETSGVIAQILISSLFAVFGFASSKRNRAVFMIGIVLYTLDGLLYIAFESWLAVAFHGYAIYRMIVGFMAIKEYNSLAEKLS